MNFDWKNWCRFCGNAENNVKFEFTIDIEYYFKISDQHPKVCQHCSLSLNDFQKFVDNTTNSNKLFQELHRENDLDNFKLNEIREKYNLEVLDFADEDKNNFLGLDIKEDSNSNSSFIVNDFQEYSEYIKQETSTVTVEKEFKKGKSKKSKHSISHQECSEEDIGANVSKRAKRTKSIETQKRRTYASDNESNEDHEDPSWIPEKKSKIKKVNVSKKAKASKKEPKEEPAKPLTKKVIQTICHICNEPFISMTYLEKHCLKEHDCRPQVPCICGYILNNYFTYNKHRKRCCGKYEAPYQCDLCENKFYFVKSQIAKHMDLKHKIDSRKLNCKTCGKSFKEPCLLRKHERVHLPDEIKLIYPCPHCPQKYPSIGQRNNHVKIKHGNLEYMFTCHICARGFINKARLDQHLISHSDVFDYPCKICSKAFKTEGLLKSHNQTHAAETFFCEICNKGFRRFSSRTKHMTVHSDEKPFPCPEPTCTRAFKRKTDADSHHNTIHLGKYPFYCKVCNEGFHKSQLRMKHLQEFHPVEYIEHKEKYKFMYEKNRIMYAQNT